MATLNSTTYRVITPKSSTTLAYEEYEFLLSWKNKYGTPESYMFHDWINSLSIDSETINIFDPDRIDSIKDNEENIIELTAEDIDRTEVEAFEDLLRSKNVIRVFRTNSVAFEAGGYERVAVLGGSIDWQQGKQRFNVTVKIQRLSKPKYS